MKAYWGVEVYLHAFLTSALDLGEWSASRPYPQGKSPCYPLDKRLDGLQRRSGRGGNETNSQPLQGLEPPIIQPVAQIINAMSSSLLNSFNININVYNFVLFQVRLWTS
jgi:hypothetical protein